MSERFLDVSHEALIRGWPRLRGWLDEDRAGLRLQRRITETAEEWQHSNRDDDLLYRGARLIQAQEWRARHEAELNPLEREFLDAGIVLKQRQGLQRRRQLVILGTVTFGFVTAIPTVFLTYSVRKKALQVASRGNVSLARYSKEGGKNAQALAHLAQALRLSPKSREASGFTAAMLTQLGWCVPLTGSMRHHDGVISAQFSPDGQRVVTASKDNTARVWDAASGKPIGEPMKHEDWVNSAQFSPDGQRVVTASGDKTARLWDAASGKPVGEPMKHEDAFYSAQFSRDGQRVVTASSDKTARVWDAASGKPIGEPMKHERWVSSAQFSPDGQRVVTASGDKTARLWDAASGGAIGEPMTHEDAVESAQFSPDGQRVVTASRDRTARLWDAASGGAIGEPMTHEDAVISAQFSRDGQRVVTASSDKTARVWDGASGKSIGEPMEHKGTVNSAQFSSDGQRVVTASLDKTARLWDAAIMTDKDTTEDILSLAELAEATGGMTLETVGQVESLKLVAPEQARALRDKIAAKFLEPSSKLTPLQRFMKWSVSDRRSRTISPFSQVTVSEWLENRIKEGTVEGLRAAMQVDPANARVTAHLGGRLADQALEQSNTRLRVPLSGDDPDEARRVRGEADFLTSRAVKLAPDNDEVKKLRSEVITCLELKTN
jgi:WD40 repeat protein